MSFLLLLLLVLPLCVSAKHSGLEETVKDDLEETMYKSEKLSNVNEEVLMQRMERMEISWETEKADLEKKLETKNVEIENLQNNSRRWRCSLKAGWRR